MRHWITSQRLGETCRDAIAVERWPVYRPYRPATFRPVPCHRGNCVSPTCPQGEAVAGCIISRSAMQRTLSDAFVRSVKPLSAGRLEISDLRCVGLWLRITPNNIKTWTFRFRDRATGRPGRATIGQYPAI